jgi:hypothetical protein
MERTKKIVALLLALVFTGYFASTTLFSHSHVISGASIIHSHIHTDSHHDTQSGNHTKQCITLIAHVSQLQYIVFYSDCLPIPLQFPLYKSKCVEISHWIVSQFFQNHSLRAPPIV